MPSVHQFLKMTLIFQDKLELKEEHKSLIRTTIIMKKLKLVCFLSLLLPAIMIAQSRIIQDGEYNYLRAQHGEKWDQQDKVVDAQLAEIRKNNDGKRPNILYILIDDVGFGEMGMPELNYVRGIKTPNINKFASEGMSFMNMYTEPSCTPTRTSFMTGRLPIRCGMGEVKVALVGEGLPSSEKTIAEVLSDSGYNTVHIGKWHMGDIEEAYPHNQGFDFASFPVHQQVQLGLMTDAADKAQMMQGYMENSYTDEFAIDTKFKPSGLVTSVEGYKGQAAREVGMEAGEEWTAKKNTALNERYQAQALQQLAELSKKEEPFYLQYWPILPFTWVRSERDVAETRNGGSAAEDLLQMDKYVGEIMQELKKLDLEDNTIVVLMGDNGPFLYGFQGRLGMSDMIYRGGKSDITEGGIRVNAFIRWPDVIEEKSYAGDMIHVMDFFQTFAHIADAKKYIPTDRVYDAIDQTALLLEGETNGRRDYIYAYQTFRLAAIVKQKFKMHMPAPGVPGAGAPVYDLTRDPREENPLIEIALWSGASFQDMLKRHLMTMEKYPNAKLGKGRPYEGIENLRPETIETVETFMSWH